MTHNDLVIEITIGGHRKDTNWTRKKLKWGDFLNKLRKPYYTRETYRDFLQYDKAVQDEIKDVGGFVGGLINGGHRKKSAILSRTLVTLDLDHMTPEQGAGLWGRALRLLDCCMCLYSTHKHSPEKPRLRLIIPLDRAVTVDEYQAIGRKIAGLIGIDMFDHTTFQPERLMYWQSCSIDGVYEFREAGGLLLSADEVLEWYGSGEAWKNTALWPMAERERKERKVEAGVQGDPLGKRGLIGAFNRVFTIPEAIETFLPNVYIDAGDGRYTYAQGSTSAGAILYYNEAGLPVFLYSHHGTDPCSETLVNAFDMVRLHKFGMMDLKHEDQPDVTKLPSYENMIEFAARNEKVKQQITRERIENAQEAFKDIGLENAGAGIAVLPDEEGRGKELTDEQEQEWTKKLDMDKKGNIFSTIHNVIIILENDPAFKGQLYFNMFRNRKMVRSKLPWRRVLTYDNVWKDSDESALRHYLEKMYGITNNSKVADAVDTVMMRHRRHPVREYLQGLQWDGVQRIETMLIDYLGCEDNAYVRAVARKVMVAAVSRIMRPGCKFDNVLTLVGEEGKMKSMFIDKLAAGWFSDSLTTVAGKDAMEQIQGFWLIELAELTALNKAEHNAIKNFISKRVDSFRAAYARNGDDFPRQCIFFATTNIRRFLKGIGGDRRFWPVMVDAVPPKYSVGSMTADDVGQLWAEAMELFRDGELLYLPEKLYNIARGVQEEHTEKDERADAVEEYLNVKVPRDWYEMPLMDRRAWLKGEYGGDIKETMLRDRITAREIWTECFGKQIADMGRRDSEAIFFIMDHMKGWKKAKGVIRVSGIPGTVKGYHRYEGEV